MNTKDPKLTALQFNEHINNQDVEEFSVLMTEDHTFIDREDEVTRGKETMTRGWIEFFQSFPEYRNTFTRVESHDPSGDESQNESQGDVVILIGYATWSKGAQPDHVIWTATIRDDLVAEWRIYQDTNENRRRLGIT